MEPTAQSPHVIEENHKVVAFPVVGAARPKRRWKKASKESAAPPAPRVIVPMRSEAARPLKFARSGRPFQIWKAPGSSTVQAEPEKTPPTVLFREFLAFSIRMIVSQSGTRFRLSPP